MVWQSERSFASTFLITLLIGLFWRYQGCNANVINRSNDDITLNHHTYEFFKSGGHPSSILRREHDREHTNHRQKKAISHLEILNQLIKHSDRFSVVKHVDRHARLRCNWKGDLKAHGSCMQFLRAEAGIIVDSANTFANAFEKNRVEIDLLSSDYKLLLSRLQSVLPMEWTIPVQLHDFRGPMLQTNNVHNVSGAFKYPPRYVVGTLHFPVENSSDNKGAPAQMLETTFDLGNSGKTILMVEDCRGCYFKDDPTNGCPDIVPTCSADNSTRSAGSYVASPGLCWASHPHQFVPNYAIKYTNATCDETSLYNNKIVDGAICKQCFQQGNHSRFVTLAKLEQFSFKEAIVESTIYKMNDHKVSRIKKNSPILSDFNFAALIRTVPIIDRIWSNIGIGAGSDFMKQLNATRLLIDFNYYQDVERSNIVFNPSPMIYAGWGYAHYKLEQFGTKKKRVHEVHGFYFGQTFRNMYVTIAREVSSMFFPFHKKVDFHIDSGNQGIALADKDLQNYMVSVTGGVWHKGVLFTPHSPDTAPDFYINLSLTRKATVQIPGSIWALPHFSSKDIDDMQAANLFLLDDDQFPSLFTQILASVTTQSRPPPGYYPSIFFKYAKNVFGLPFLAAPGFRYVFDDEKAVLYVGKGKKSDKRSKN